MGMGLPMSEIPENDRQEDQAGEEPVLDSGDTLETDDPEDDPLDTGIIPPDRWQDTDERESLDEQLAEEEPDQTPDDYDRSDPTRSGRLVATADPDGEELADDVGIDGGAATAEEAAMHDTDGSAE